MIRFLFACGAMLIALDAAAQSFVVPPELWDRPRTGRAVLEHPVLRQAVGAWLAQPGARLVVHHGAGQEPSLAAAELRAWLAAFAVESARIVLRNELQPSEPLRLEIEGNRESRTGNKE
jgi:hypothetical protein